MMKLFRYDVEFRFVKGVNLILADTLSRAFLENDATVESERPRIMQVNSFEDVPDARLQEVRNATEEDCELQILMQTVNDGWPQHRNHVPYSVLPFFEWRDELSIQEGIIVKGKAILIPRSLRSDMKTRLHSAHLGYDSMMRRARGKIFWPGMANDIKHMAEQCEICQESKPKNRREPLLQHSDGAMPWNKIGLDLYEIKGRQYLVAVDYYSNFTEVDFLSTTNTSQVITILKKQFARFGIPSTIVSDNGPQFSSEEFKQFTRKWRINHTTSSPNHPQGNGKAESAVKVIKNLIKKALKDGRDQYEALLELRNTPRQDTGLSPNQMMFGRNTRSMIPTTSYSKMNNDSNLRSARKHSVKKWYDKRSKELPTLETDDSVYFEQTKGRNWKLGKIKEKISDRSIIVQSQEGVTYRRNRSHIRPTKVTVRIRDVSPPREFIRFPKEFINLDQTNEPEVSDEIPKDDELSKPISTDSVTTRKDFNKTTVDVKPSSRPRRTISEPTYLKDFVRN